MPERSRHEREVEDQQIASVFDWRGKGRDVTWYAELVGKDRTR